MSKFESRRAFLKKTGLSLSGLAFLSLAGWLADRRQLLGGRPLRSPLPARPPQKRPRSRSLPIPTRPVSSIWTGWSSWPMRAFIRTAAALP